MSTPSASGPSGPSATAPEQVTEQETVYTGMTGVTYHRRWHSRGPSVTWTREFAENGLLLRPCKVCYPTPDSGREQA